MLPKRVLTKIIYGMKILIVSQYYYPEKVSLTSMAEGLVKRGHDVLVVTGQPNYGLGHIQEGYENIFDEEINGVRVHRCKLFPRGNSGMSRLRNYISFWRNSKKYLGHIRRSCPPSPPQAGPTSMRRSIMSPTSIIAMTFGQNRQS